MRDVFSPHAVLPWLPDSWFDHAAEQARRRETCLDRRCVRLLAGLHLRHDHAAAERAALAWLCAMRDEEYISGAVFAELVAYVAGEHRI